jgi:hypothetical protein
VTSSAARAAGRLPALLLLDTCRPGRGREDARAAVVPAHLVARRFALEHLLDPAPSRRPIQPRCLDDDGVSDASFHVGESSAPGRRAPEKPRRTPAPIEPVPPQRRRSWRSSSALDLAQAVAQELLDGRNRREVLVERRHASYLVRIRTRAESSSPDPACANPSERPQRSSLSGLSIGFTSRIGVLSTASRLRTRTRRPSMEMIMTR